VALSLFVLDDRLANESIIGLRELYTPDPVWANDRRRTTNDGFPRLTLLSLPLYTQD